MSAFVVVKSKSKLRNCTKTDSLLKLQFKLTFSAFKKIYDIV